MRKLKLDIHSLVVQTFRTDGASERKGTVQAHDSQSEATTGGPWFCQFECETSIFTCQPIVSCVDC